MDGGGRVAWCDLADLAYSATRSEGRGVEVAAAMMAKCDSMMRPRQVGEAAR